MNERNSTKYFNTGLHALPYGCNGLLTNYAHRFIVRAEISTIRSSLLSIREQINPGLVGEFLEIVNTMPEGKFVIKYCKSGDRWLIDVIGTDSLSNGTSLVKIRCTYSEAFVILRELMNPNDDMSIVFADKAFRE